MTRRQPDGGLATLWLWGSKPTPLKSHTQVMQFTLQNLNSYFPWPHQQMSPWTFLPFSHHTYHPPAGQTGGQLSGMPYSREWGRSWDATLVLWDISADGAQFPVTAWHFGCSLVCVIPFFGHSLWYAVTLGRYFKDLQILLVIFSSRDYSISPAVTVLALPMQLDTLQTSTTNIRQFMHTHSEMILKHC